LSGLILLLILLLPFKLEAQKKWTLEECIKHALDNNIQIKRQVLTANMANNYSVQAKMNLLPSFNIGGSHEYNFGRSVDPFTNDFISENTTADNIYAQAQLVLFNGFQNYNSIGERHFNMLASLQDVEKVRNDITLNIATAYLQILFNRELINVSESQLEVTNLQIEKTRKLVEVGNKAQGELLAIQAQAANERMTLTNAKNNLRISLLTLAQMLDLQIDTIGGFDVVVPSNIETSGFTSILSVDSVYMRSLEFLPEIKGAEFRLKGMEKSLAVKRGQALPTLGLTAVYYTGYSDARRAVTNIEEVDVVTGYVGGDVNQPVTNPGFHFTYGNYPFQDQLKDNAYKSVGFNLNIPIFNRYQTTTAIKNAKLDVYDARLALDQSKQNLYKTIQQAYADALNAHDKYLSASEAVKSNEEAFKYTEQKYSVGILSTVEYNVGKNNLTKARGDLLQAKYEFIFKTKILDFYLGNPITL
jgi:outer membrane protein